MIDLIDAEKIIRKLYREKLGKKEEQLSVYEWHYENKSYVVHIMGRDLEPQFRTEIRAKDIEDYLGKTRDETNIIKALRNLKSIHSHILL